MIDQTTNQVQWARAKIDPFETFKYDPNGNITDVVRLGMTGTGSILSFNVMDLLTYNYETTSNRLKSVADGASSSNALFPDDINSGQATNNYAYDQIGNLTKDSVEGIAADKIIWTVYGKIDSITKTIGSPGVTTGIKYTYDPAGNRISKAVKIGSASPVTTWYVRDAQGNVMGTYVQGNSSVNSGSLSLTELSLYGSGRLGLSRQSVNVQSPSSVPTISVVLGGDIHYGKILNFNRGRKLFELSNHLGNVQTVLSDRKIGMPDVSNTALVGYYRADVVSATDYYAFGMPVPMRTYNSEKYRYGFNGKENDNEVKGTGNQLDFGSRIYDPRIGKWLSVDRINQPFISPYNYCLNNPIMYVDSDGKLQRDAKGNIIFVPLIRTGQASRHTGMPLYDESKIGIQNGIDLLYSIHNSEFHSMGFGDTENGGFKAFFQAGYVFTDKGRPVLVQNMLATFEIDKTTTEKGTEQEYSNITLLNNNSYEKTNCYGRSVTNGQFFINDLAQFNVILNDEYAVAGKPGSINSKTKFQEGDILSLGADHYIVATLDKSGKIIWNSQFNSDPTGNVQGSLGEITKDLTSKYGQGFNVRESTLYRKIGADQVQQDGKPKSNPSIKRMIQQTNKDNNEPPPPPETIKKGKK